MLLLQNFFKQQQDYSLIQLIIAGVVIILISKFLILPFFSNKSNTKMTKLTVGDRAPDFTAPDKDGKSYSLKDFADKILVLYFYPKDSTPGCTKEACSFRDNYEQFTDAGAVVVGISSDGAESHSKFSAKYRLPFTLLTDNKGEIAKSYGVKKELLLIPGRSTFIIDKNQNIVLIHSSLLNAESHITESLKVIEKLKSQ
ncbi:hypothetical protein RB653_002462 [Dictyostelium firmibasis]|uniref:thioredoxin-dependent peroxiredoxin n=1 Tax=Dictyostelium firmibasis TaxID=79012 RepID=A0AAN7YN16_9MYCE